MIIQFIGFTGIGVRFNQRHALGCTVHCAASSAWAVPAFGLTKAKALRAAKFRA